MSAIVEISQAIQRQSARKPKLPSARAQFATFIKRTGGADDAVPAATPSVTQKPASAAQDAPAQETGAVAPEVKETPQNAPKGAKKKGGVK